jgi:hypothetical protein
MAHLRFVQSNIPPEDEPRAYLEGQIRSGLLQAFPLPAADQATDEKFRRLLDALARRSGDA